MSPGEKKNLIKLQKRLLILQYKVTRYELDGVAPPETLLSELVDTERLIAIILRKREKSLQTPKNFNTKISS